MRLYFHLQDKHEEVRDLVGVEVSDLNQAHTQALRAVAELQAEDRPHDWSGWVLTVADADGTVLLTIDIAGGR